MITSASSSNNEDSHDTETSMSASPYQHATPASDTSAVPHRFSKTKLLFASILLSIIIFVIVDSLTNRHIQSGFQTFLDWISDNVVDGVFAFMGVYFIATVCFVPGSILTLGSGFVFGKAVGLGYGVALAAVTVFVGASLGAIASFLLGRYLLRDCVGRVLVKRYPLVKALDEGEQFSFRGLVYLCLFRFTFHHSAIIKTALQQKGLQIFLLLRLSPIIPFNVINYIGGFTAITLRDYSLALFGILPGTVLYCFIGASAGSLTESESVVDGTVTIVSIGGYLSCACFLFLFTSRECNILISSSYFLLKYEQSRGYCTWIYGSLRCIILCKEGVQQNRI